MLALCISERTKPAKGRKEVAFHPGEICASDERILKLTCLLEEWSFDLSRTLCCLLGSSETGGTDGEVD